MRRFYLFGFALLMAFDTLAQLSFKIAGTHALPVAANLAWLLRVFSQPWIYGALIGYIGAFFTWMSLLKHAPIGPAFAASHLEVISVMLLSAWLFHEPLTATRVLGAAAIVAGIVCLGLAESHEPDADKSGDEPIDTREYREACPDPPVAHLPPQAEEGKRRGASQSILPPLAGGGAEGGRGRLADGRGAGYPSLDRRNLKTGIELASAILVNVHDPDAVHRHSDDSAEPT